MRKIRLKPTESYCQKYLYTKIMTSKCKIIKYKLNANIFFQIYFCSTFSVRIQKVKINWKGLWLFERRHSKNTIWCESTTKTLGNESMPSSFVLRGRAQEHPSQNVILGGRSRDHRKYKCSKCGQYGHNKKWYYR